MQQQQEDSQKFSKPWKRHRHSSPAAEDSSNWSQPKGPGRILFKLSGVYDKEKVLKTREVCGSGSHHYTKG